MKVTLHVNSTLHILGLDQLRDFLAERSQLKSSIFPAPLSSGSGNEASGEVEVPTHKHALKHGTSIRTLLLLHGTGHQLEQCCHPDV